MTAQVTWPYPCPQPHEQRICERLAEGEMLLDICKDKEFSSRRTVQRWVRSEPEFAYQYALARACALEDGCCRLHRLAHAAVENAVDGRHAHSGCQLLIAHDGS